MNTPLIPELNDVLPLDADQATLVGRLWDPHRGPVPIKVQHGRIHDLSTLAPTLSQLLAWPDAAKAIAAHTGADLGSAHELIQASRFDVASDAAAHVLAPCDLHAIKAAGVTFVASMLERVIEERARGDATRAQSVREAVQAVMGEDLRAVKPGSAQAAELKRVLIEQGVWSQYLEVGIGPDAEVFTKSQPMSAVGVGAEIGIHAGSEWNNPEPEVVLCVSPQGEVIGATLGNDVNLRDFEGRSALLLGKAKDNNASCAIGPFIRLFDARFGLDDVLGLQLELQVLGTEGYELQGMSAMSQISRHPLDIVRQAMGAHHQYPDGMMLFLGTLFAPTQDRPLPGRASGQGFTHRVGDRVRIHSPRLGTLTNWVNTSDQVKPWTYGVGALIADLIKRG
ncbi:MAG: fumarylacetoacetate hydrolase [Betaproteobacteria bacterium]|jgi:fumarylacetoacetate (FAA) hydrolase family protein|nr:fumarylacetoacetate hydrolase [Betaproteobacteria bacterium]NBP44682.1 fumarylacetoacetate hydrolase [Betaproteobacteria bacterium]